MMVFGQLPALATQQGKDCQYFLKMLLPKGTEAGLTSLRNACKSLHLAFKDCTTSDDVYDALVLIFRQVCSH